jgi:hypothetical protein
MLQALELENSCILDLTSRRAKELRDFTQDVQAAAKKAFVFAKDRTDINDDE